MNEIQITIDPRVLTLNDDRVIALKLNKITPLEFWKLTTMVDPWFGQQNRISYIPIEEHEKNVEKFYIDNTKWIKDTGQLSPFAIYKNKETFLKVYPELQASFDKIPNTIKEDPNCPSCTVNRECKFLMDDLLAVPYNDRDLSPLESLMNPHIPNEKLITRYGFLKLKHIEYEVDRNDIKLPPPFMKKYPEILDETEFNKITSESFTYNYNLMRPSCIDCFKKHVIHSCIFLREILKGYTKEKGHIHQDQVCCELKHAVEETFKDFNDKSIAVQKLLDEYQLTFDHQLLLDSLLKLLANEFNMKEDDVYTIGLLIEIEDKLILMNPELSEQIKLYRRQLQGQTKIV